MEFLVQQIVIIINMIPKIVYFFIMFCSPVIFKIIIVYSIFIVGIPLKRIFLYFFPSLQLIIKEKITNLFTYYDSKGFFMTFYLFSKVLYLLPKNIIKGLRQKGKRISYTRKNYLFLMFVVLLFLYVFGLTKAVFVMFLFLCSVCSIIFYILYVKLYRVYFLMKIQNVNTNVFTCKILFLFIYLFFLLEIAQGNYYLNELLEKVKILENCCIKIKKEIIFVIEKIKVDYFIFFIWAKRPDKYLAYKLQDPFYMWLFYHGIMFICYRYGYMMAGGGIIIIPEKAPVAVETINLQTPYMQRFGQTQLPVVPYEPIINNIPEKPPENLYAFIQVVANNPIEIRSHPEEETYEKQFNYFVENHPTFGQIFPKTWHEFISGARWEIVEATKGGEITALPIPIEEETQIDFATTEALYQNKTKGNVSTGEIEIYGKKYKKCLEEGVIIFISYDTLDKGQLMEDFSQNLDVEPRYLKQIVLHQRHMMPLVTQEKLHKMEIWHEKYSTYIPECQKIIKGEGFLHCLPYLQAFTKKILKR